MDNFPWLPTVLSAIPTAFVGIWTFIQWYASRKDKTLERGLSEREKRDQNLEKERKELSEINSVLFAQLRADVDRYRKIIEEKNTERWYAWDRAHFWHQIAWDMRNEAAYARQIIESAGRIANEPPKKWEKSLDLPPFDTINTSNSNGPPRQTA